jgi:tetratricopeptide (TPR) repeat protein
VLGWGLAMAVAGLTWLVFRPVLRHGFVGWDDTILLVDTHAYRELWWPALRHAFTSTLIGHYAPLTWLSFSLDAWLWGPGPFGFHLTNLVLHVLNAGLFYALARALIGRASTLTEPSLGLGAASAALVFAVHPMRAETVAWLTERRGVLSGLFALLAVLAYLRATQGRTGRRLALAGSVAAFLLALLAKESSLILPAGLVILDVYPLRRLTPPGRGWVSRAAWPTWREKLPYFGLAAAWSVIAFRSQVAGAKVIHLEPETWLGLVLQGLWYHVQKELLPVRLSPLHEFTGRIELRDPATVVAGVGVLAVTMVVLGLRHRWPAGLAAWTWQAIALAPFMGLAHAGQQITADRYSYLAAWGWALVGGAGVGLALRAARRGHLGAIALTLASGIAVAVLGLLTVQQARIWESRGTLWLHAVAVAPDCAVCRYNLGTWLLDHGEAAAALGHFDAIRARYPAVARFQGAAGVALAGLGRYRDAEPHLRAAAAELSGSDGAVMRLNLAGALVEQNRLEEGLAEVHRALAAWPAEAAVVHLQQGVASKPGKPVLRLALAEAYGRLGQSAQEAVERAALAELHPALARLAESGRATTPGR